MIHACGLHPQLICKKGNINQSITEVIITAQCNSIFFAMQSIQEKRIL
jgi:hypothetical protein